MGENLELFIEKQKERRAEHDRKTELIRENNTGIRIAAKLGSWEAYDKAHEKELRKGNPLYDEFKKGRR